MCRVLLVGCSALAMKSAPWSLMCSVVGECWAQPSSCRIDCGHGVVFPASAAAVNSASVDDSAAVAWNFDLHAMTPPVIMCATPVTDHPCALSSPQSESAHECTLLWVLSGNVESLDLSVMTVSCGVHGRSSLGVLCQWCAPLSFVSAGHLNGCCTA